MHDQIFVEDLEHLQFEKLEAEDRIADLEDELAQTEMWLENRTSESEAWHMKYKRLKSDFDDKVRGQNENLYLKVSKYADIILRMDAMVRAAQVRYDFRAEMINNLNTLRKEGGLPPI